METVKKIKILESEAVYSNEHFSYLLASEKADIKNDVENSHSIIIGVLTNDEKNCTSCAVIDFHNDFLHLRETCGAFIKDYKFIDIFVIALAKAEDKKQISIAATKTPLFVKKKLGFEEINGEYIRKVA